MPSPDSTVWETIERAAQGDPSRREEFARRYAPAIRACLEARWRNDALREEIEDAIQEVFVDFLRPGGALGRADPAAAGGFRAFLFGVVRNVARRFEERRAQRRERQPGDELGFAGLEGREEGASVAFDRAWAHALVAQAVDLHLRRAREGGADALRRADLLRLRFQEEMPIREIAGTWGEDPARLHHEYAAARREFKEALLDVVAQHHPGNRREIASECARLLDCLR